MPSLLDFAQSPESGPAPLPPLAARRRNGSWPVGLLPIPEIAADLARFGYRYRRGSGFTAYGQPATDPAVAHAAALVLTMAADGLHSAPAPTAHAFATLAAVEADADRLQAAAHGTTDNYELAEALFAATAAAVDDVAALVRARLDGPALLNADDQAARLGDRFEDHAAALRRTARDLKASLSAQSQFLKALRAVLPAPEATATPDPAAKAAAAAEFLATLDELPKLRRSDLAAYYFAAGSPGALPLADLRDLAAERWGAPRKIRGEYAYRPNPQPRRSARRSLTPAPERPAP